MTREALQVVAHVIRMILDRTGGDTVNLLLHRKVAEALAAHLDRKPNPETGMYDCGCGGRPEISHSFKHHLFPYVAQCRRCAARGDWARTERDARRFWNLAVAGDEDPPTYAVVDNKTGKVTYDALEFKNTLEEKLAAGVPVTIGFKVADTPTYETEHHCKTCGDWFKIYTPATRIDQIDYTTCPRCRQRALNEKPKYD